MNKLPVVVLLGRVNVGKSTLFNKLIGQRKALESKIAGTTRDYNQGVVNWNNTSFKLIDTGGYVDYRTTDAVTQETLQFAENQARTADLVVLIMDFKNGFTPFDQELLTRIKKINKHLVVAINKVDKIKNRDASILEFSALGIDDLVAISAVSGGGTGNLLDLIVSKLPTIGSKKTTKVLPALSPEINLAIVGQPNVGKSSLLNLLVNKKRAIVAATPHTTRDAHDEIITYQDKLIKIMDTAGIRRRTKKGDLLEKFSIDLALQTLRRSHIALLVLDISQPITYQDKHLAEKTVATGNSVIIIANKWDLVPDKETNTINEYQKYIYGHLPYLDWAPIIFTSAVKQQRITNILEQALQVWQERFRKIEDNTLDKFIKKIIKLHLPSRGRGVAHPHIYRLVQTGVNPPFFELTIKYQRSLHSSYIRFVENQLRAKFGFYGTPIKFYINSLK